MSASLGLTVSTTYAERLRFARVIRYAGGTTLGMAVAMGFDWQLSYLAPVLALSFLAPPSRCPSFRQGFGFIATIFVASQIGLLLSRTLLPFPLVYVPFVSLLLFRLFHAKAGGRSPLLITWLMISLLVIPLVAMLSPGVASLVTRTIPFSAAVALGIVWIAYAVFPDPKEDFTDEEPSGSGAVAAPPPASAQFRIALEATAVVAPAFALFYTFEWVGSILILVFVAILSSQPGFAKNYKAGAGLILGNVIGGLVAILIYELLVVVPEFPFLLLLTLLAGLIFGSLATSGKPTAPLFAMAFSTVVLILGSTTSGNSEAGAKVYTRVVQIMAGVLYVVVAFGTIERFRTRRSRR